MNGGMLLLRQIHPTFVQAGFATSQAFRPTPKDQGALSVYDGDLISAADSWTHFTRDPNRRSCGTAADECTEESLPARPNHEPFPEHAIIDFTGLSAGQCQTEGKKLQAKAQARGWMYRIP